jgi:hypothetical protein
MNLVIAGARDLNDLPCAKKIGLLRIIDQEVDKIEEQLEEKVTGVVSGKARGGDRLGEIWAELRGIPLDPPEGFVPDWKKLGKSAGYHRNREMGEYGDALLALRFHNSRGTQLMIGIMEELDKPFFIVNIKDSG